MSLRVVTGALAAAAAISTAGARPMHADIEPHYHRYLEERADVAVELEAWMSKFKAGAAANGWLPVSESRSADEVKEDQMQRFFLTKEKIKTLERENPDATFSTDSPFSLLTDDEFHAYVGNAYRKVEDAAAAQRKLRGAHGYSGGGNQGDERSQSDSTHGGWTRSQGGWSSRSSNQGGGASQQHWGGYRDSTGWQANTNGNGNGGAGGMGTWGAVVPTKWLDWWNQITSSHTNNNNYRPETVAPYNPDAPATNAPEPTTPEPVTSAPEPASVDNDNDNGDNNNSEPVVAPEATPAPASVDDNNNSEPVVAPEETPAPASVDDNNNSEPVVAPEETPVPASNEDSVLTQAPDNGYDFDTIADAPVAADADTATADTVDWSKGNCMAPIQNQGVCGSCWAFASVAAVESAQCIVTGGQSVVKYSEQQVASCDSKSYGCNGGAPVYAFEYIQNQGLCTEGDFPYSATKGQNAACSASCTKSNTGIKGFEKVGTSDEELTAKLREHPVVVAVAAGNNAWKQYTGGVLNACDSVQIDHAVLAVGFDGNAIKIRNSWGDKWGDAGYVYLKRGTAGMGTCGVFSDMSRPLFR
ncbi:hypothetical protein PybrP1_008991 [[Pythium] brassicae (nom. inval.)]|nr:hypothetical protein PybrP1_008991 [[Pythium] brassicae (nom. inval.)]